MKKAVFLFALFVGYGFISHNAVAYNLTIDSLVFDISCARHNPAYLYKNEGNSTGFADGQYRNGVYGVDLTGYAPTYQYDNFRFEMTAQVPENHGLDGMSKAASFPEPVTMLLFGLGLVLFAESGRTLKRRNLRKRNKSSPYFFLLKEAYPALKTPAIRGQSIKVTRGKRSLFPLAVQPLSSRAYIPSQKLDLGPSLTYLIVIDRDSL